MSDCQSSQTGSSGTAAPSTGRLMIKADKYRISAGGSRVTIRLGEATSWDAAGNRIGKTHIGPEHPWIWSIDGQAILFPYEKSEMTAGLPTQRTFNPTGQPILKEKYWRYDDPTTQTAVSLNRRDILGDISGAGSLLDHLYDDIRASHSRASGETERGAAKKN